MRPRRVDWGFFRRALLARCVYREACAATETFEGDLGMQLLYLVGAVLEDKRLVLHLDVAEENEVHQLLQDIFDADHQVWRYIATQEGTRSRIWT